MPSAGDKLDHSKVGSIQAAVEQLRTARDALCTRRELRESNLQPARLTETQLKALDSSVKKNTALIRRLRTVGDFGPALLEDVRRTNQSKYVSEAVAALAEANLKVKEIIAATQVCSLLHQRYADFGSELNASLKQLLAPDTRSAGDEERVALARRRIALRLLVELLSLGVSQDATGLLLILQGLVAEGERENPDAHAALALVSAFVKAAREELLGYAPRPPADLPADLLPEEGAEASTALTEAAAAFATEQAAYDAELAKAFALPSSTREQFRRVAERGFDAAVAALVREHTALAEVERETTRILNHRGELSEEAAAAYERQRRAFEALQRTAATLSEALERPLPALPESDVTRMRTGGGVTLVTTREVGVASGGLFEDEEAAAFYQSLPDLRAVVPAVLLGEAESTAAGTRPDPDAANGSGNGGGGGAEAAVLGKERAAGEADQPVDAAQSATEAASSSAAAKDARAEVDALLARLPTLDSRLACDELAVAFCYVNSKAARRRLGRALAEAAGGAPQLLPHYARVAATLAQVFPDVAPPLVAALEDEFATLQAHRDPTQRTLEARLRNARYLGELAKFRLVPLGSVFSMLKSLLDDFSGHNVDAAAALVEAAGRFLLRLPETETRMANMLEVMMKLKNSRNLDARQSLLLESAFYAARPPERTAARRKQRPPLHEYMRHLVHERLTHADLKQVVRKLRRLPWAANEAYLVRCLISVARSRVSSAPLAASLGAGLAHYHPSLGVALADAVLEEVRAGLETPQVASYQRRVAHMRLLGELYNYRLLDSRTVFDTLYLLLAFGHEGADTAARLDPPGSTFHICLVCVLLSACGGYFCKGSAARRLDRFLAFFQRYLLAKLPLPVDVEFDVQDLVEALRPNLVRFARYEEAAAAVADIEAAEAAAAATGEESDASDSDAGSEADGGARGGRGFRSRAASVEASGDEAEGDDEVRLLGSGTSAAQERDEEFEAELAALVLKHQGRALPAAAASAPSGELNGAATNGGGGVAGTTALRVVLRRGNKDDRSRELHVPASVALAANLRAEAAAEENERAEIKRLTLRANADLDLAGTRAGQLNPNLNPRFNPTQAEPARTAHGAPRGRGGSSVRRHGHTRGDRS
ncbi:hypothetical protein WJX81_008105 [Elliptochloris bilobata]|uniref:MIF4G domain-containing protein n=1 Tax=Elliptochloris bilobata TaxID=381761 RepID=A0AAW1QWR8_9CHLO